jgi:predicted nucleic acid-binding protein
MRRHAVIADSGPLYASIDPDDQYHARAQREGQKLADDGYAVVVSYPTLFESYSLVAQRLGLGPAHTFLDELRERSGLITPTPDDYARACGLPRQFNDQRLTLFDALIAVLSRRLNLAVWTYDADFDIVGATVWR